MIRQAVLFLVLVAADAAVFGLTEADSPLVRVVTTPLTSPGASRGVAWADFNKDGWLDLFVATSGSHYLFTNKQDGTFARTIPPAFGSDSGGNGAAWADFNNDGYPELVVPRNNNISFYSNEGGIFTRISTNGIARASGSFWSASCADYDRDGLLDLFVTTGFTRGNNYLFHNEGNGVFTRITNSIAGKDIPEFSDAAAWGDYDNDGWPDLFVANTRDFSNGNAFRPSFLYHNLGGGVFEKITNSIVTIGHVEGGLAQGAWGDYDNDGLLDLFVCGYAMGANALQPHRLYHNEGGGVFSKATNAGSIDITASHAQGGGWADYDNDGWLDLFIAGGGPAGFKDVLYHNNADGTFTRITSGSVVNENGEGAGAAWGDANNDGFPDLYVANFQAQTSEKNAFYLSSGNSNSWLTIRLDGRASNRSGIGAKVRLKATIKGRTFWQLREISASSGYLSQPAAEANFGLGDATRAEAVRIEWPSGMVQEFSDIPARQRLVFREPPGLTMRSRKELGFEITVRGGRDVPYQIESSFDLLSWSQFLNLTNSNSMIVSNSQQQIFFRCLER